MFMVTHNAENASRAHRVLHIRDGSLVSGAEPDLSRCSLTNRQSSS
jgi:ABC-type lipoprotein export system ATPase subunit